MPSMQRTNKSLSTIRNCGREKGACGLRMTAKQYKQRANRGKSKYRNRKIELDGHVFDSKAEARYYKELLMRQNAKDILFFKLQPKYQLVAGFEKDGKKHRAIHYIADFEVHNNDGTIDVIDVKGFKTDVFRLKEKLFHKKFPHKLILVQWKNGRFVEI